ncbi:MAG: putative 3-phenylpropionic acid transporter [Pseudomonadota bacterium]
MALPVGQAGQGGRLWPFAALSATYFAHIGFFNPYLSLWLKDLGFGLYAIGLLTAIQSGTRLFAPYLWGWLSDRTGRRVAWMRYCAGVALVGSAGFWWPWEPATAWGVAMVLFLVFTHTSAMMPLSEAVLAQVVSHGAGFDAGRYGRIRLWGSVGFLVTVLLAGAWFERQGMGGFPVWTSLTLAGVACVVWYLPETPEARVPQGERAPSVGAVLAQAPVRWFWVALCLHILAHVAVYAFFSLYLDHLGYSKRTIGWLWAVAVVVEIAWFYAQGRWFRPGHVNRWLLWASALMALRMCGTAAWGHLLWVLVLAQVLHAVTFAAHHTACVAWLGRHFPGRLRGRGQALYAMVGYGLSGVLGGVLGGWVSTQWGLPAVFWCASAAAVFATLAVMAMARSERLAA